jgi:hypothetical protein
MYGAGKGLRAMNWLSKKGVPLAQKRFAPAVGRVLGAGTGEAAVRQATLDADENRLLETGESFARGALGEAVGIGAEKWVFKRLGGKVVAGARRLPGVRRLVDPFRGKLDLGAEDAIETLEAAGGVRPTAGQLSESKWVDRFENIIDASLTGQGRIQAYRGRVEEVATKVVNDHVARFRAGATAEDAGNLLQTALSNGAEAHRIAVGKAYQHLDSLMPGGQGQVDLGPVLKYAQAKLKIGQRRGKGGTAYRGVFEDILLSKSDKAAQEIFPTEQMAGVGRRRYVSFHEAQEIRSQLLARERLATDPIPDITAGAAADMAGHVDAAMAKASKGISGEAYEAWRAANSLVAVGKTGYNNRVIKSMVNAIEPEKVYNSLIATASTPSRIRKVRRIVEEGIARGDTDSLTWEAVQGQWLDQVIRESTDHKTLQLSGEQLLTKIHKGMGPARLAELFPVDRGKTFERFARTLYIAQEAASPDAPFAVAIKLSQAGIIFGGLTGAWLAEGEGRRVALGGSAMVLLGPVGLARVFTNPKAVRLMTTGMTHGPTTAASRTFGQLLSHIDNIVPTGAAYTAEEPVAERGAIDITDLLKESR